MEFPRIQFESTNYCNMKCVFCPNKTIIDRFFLPFDIFKNVINDISKYSLTQSISFAGNGEPLLDKNLKEKLIYCKSKNLKTTITTNSLLIKNIDDDLINSLDSIVISWQTFNKDSFNTRGLVNHDYLDYKNNILNFVKNNQGKTKIILSFLLNRKRKFYTKSLLGKNFHSLLNQDGKELIDIINEIEKILKNKNNGNILELKTKLRKDSRLVRNEVEIGENIFMNIDEFFDWGGSLNDYSKKFKRIPADKGMCKIMTDGPLIMASGKVSICCQDYDGKVTVGNLFEKSFFEILNSNLYKNIYDNFKENNIILDYCKNCKGRWEHKNALINFIYKIESRLDNIKHQINKKIYSAWKKK